MKDRADESDKTFAWLTSASIAETKRYAPQASNKTLLDALYQVRKDKAKGKTDIIRKEIYRRLEPGDFVVLENSIIGMVFMIDRYGMLLSNVNGFHTWREIITFHPRPDNVKF
jgi:hypothetical protein